MTIGRTDESGTQGQQPGGATTRAGLGGNQEQPRPHTQARPSMGSGVADLPAMLRKSPIGMSGYGEQVKKLCNTIRDILKAEAEDADIKVTILDQRQHSIALSCVLISAGVMRGTQSHVAVHTLIVEGSAGRLPKLTMNQGNQPIEITAVAGDTYNAIMWDKVKALVAQSGYPTNSIIRDAGSTTIPTEMDLTDVDRVRTVLFYANQAVQQQLEIAVGYVPQPWSVSAFTRNDRVSAKIDFTPQPVETATGLPIRSDVSIVLNATNTATSQQDMMPTAGKDFSRIDGYVDLVYKQPPRPGYGQAVVTQHYVPRFVITNFAPLLEGVNLELLLLGLSSATLLSRGNNFAWGGVFRQRFGTELNLRNIGAIGYEIPALVGSTDGKGGMIDTQASSFTLDSLYTLMSTAIFPHLVYSFDVEETGPLSFIHSIFVAAAGGHQDAHQMLVDAADRLTDGAFSRHFAGGPLVVDDNNRIHLGYYVDTKGQRRDIREVDYLAVLNMVGKNDVQLGAKWANTYDRTDLPIEVRLDERERMMNGLIGGGSMRITGYGRRITFTTEGMRALNASIHDAGLVIQPGNQSYFFGDQIIRGNDSIDQFAFSSSMVGNVFNYSNPQVAGRMIPNSTSRWGR